MIAPPETGQTLAGTAMRAMRKQWQALAKRVRRGGNNLARRLPAPIRRALDGPVSYADMLLVDHGIFRLAYLNLHEISPRAWRSAQPAPHDIARLARRGIKTIINLRGARDGGEYRLERKACAAHGITLVDFTLGSRAAPAKQSIFAAAEMFQRLSYPVLIHCKSGADRAGLMGVLYLHMQEGVPMAQALGQLSWRYGHFRGAPTGILDAFFDAYLAFDTKMPTPFLTWVAEHYDPAELKRSFRPDGVATVLVDQILRRE